MIDFIGFVMTNWEPLSAGVAAAVGVLFPAFSVYWWRASRAIKEILQVIDEEPKISNKRLLYNAKVDLRNYAAKQLEKIA